MAPHAKTIEQALINGTCTVYRAEPDATSVNRIRKHVTSELDLDEDFFLSAKWKAKSKTIIKETVVRPSPDTHSLTHALAAWVWYILLTCYLDA